MNTRQFDFFPDNAAAETTPPVPTGPKPSLFLIDGMALLYRAHYALQRAGMQNRSGQPTGALFGFLSTLLRIFETYRPHYLATAFDSREKPSATTFTASTRPTGRLHLKRCSPRLSRSSSSSKPSIYPS